MHLKIFQGSDFHIPELLLHKLIRYGLLTAAIALFAVCGSFLFPDTITVSNSVNGRELPIYCVETPEKKWRCPLMPHGETKTLPKYWKY